MVYPYNIVSYQDTLMPNSHNKAQLPSNPTLKEINWFKKQINWGELPHFYHLVASSVSECESILDHGFDNAIKRIIDKRNWNLEALGIDPNELYEKESNNKPRISLHQVFTERGFELQALPFSNDTAIDRYARHDETMEFRLWDPLTMKTVIRINQLHKFIGFYLDQGDEADKALILHSHKVVHKIIAFLQTQLNIVKVDGVTIKAFYQLCEKDSRLYTDDPSSASAPDKK